MEALKQKVFDWIDQNLHCFINNKGEIDTFILEKAAEHFGVERSETTDMMIAEVLLKSPKCMMKFGINNGSVKEISIIPKSLQYKH